MSKLIIVESPTKTKTIKEYLGKDYTVVASMGHVRDLPAAKLNVDVKNNFEPKYAIIKGKENLVRDLQKEVAKADEVYLATDPDREGEAISWHLATLLGLDMNKANRVTFNEITKTGIMAGIKDPHKIDMDLVNAQQARRILDRLVGYRLSPFVSQKIRRGLSAGRVQSVAVRLIVDREEEIRAFVPEEYWTLDAKLIPQGARKAFTAAFTGDETGKVKITTKEQADKYLSRLDGASYIVDSVKKGTRKKQPAPPFITSTLQQDASRRLGFQAKRTMKVAQELYEGVNVAGRGQVGLITYMRTDSLRISEEARAMTEKYIEKEFGKKYLPEKPRYFKSRSGAQDAHEAIRPTDVTLTPEEAKASLTSDQYKLYKLIWQRFIASLMETCVQNTVKVEIKANGCIFTANGYSVKFDGYTVLYDIDSDDEEEAMLPELSKGDELKLRDLKGNQHFTQPPSRYTEAALVKALEENGVGRPSTYASIITTILAREYVVRDGKLLKPTELGEATTGLLKDKFPKFVNTKFTAQMETNLDEIAEGKTGYVGLISEFYDDLEDTLQKAKTDMEGVKIQLEEDKTDIPCDKCGRMMVVKSGRFGKFLACPGYPECKNTKPLIQETGAKCPKCGGDVIQRKSKRGYVFYGCSNYPECDFSTWDAPVAGATCPQCGSSLFKHRANHVCLKEGCGYEAAAPRKRSKKND
ncbi:MAG: type I DNA topoisomerase [Clostridia bacterium]|nr:type I DNA topoisomerase [Clostridia bacterium]MBR5015191.1 type I DNA topoisomerase [Clostridia bacterium]MBR5976751.1 type I DNA topoisomerase [Clostridia bacterium]MBR5992024.1 type I DNA topoisomerase [Clostridia bacterium]MBR6479179.1 type I DNA topoisomerase [Clostridia bacterium]